MSSTPWSRCSFSLWSWCSCRRCDVPHRNLNSTPPEHACCFACGYDLEGIGETLACPECGETRRLEPFEDRPRTRYLIGLHLVSAGVATCALLLEERVRTGRSRIVSQHGDPSVLWSLPFLVWCVIAWAALVMIILRRSDLRRASPRVHVMLSVVGWASVTAPFWLLAAVLMYAVAHQLLW